MPLPTTGNTPNPRSAGYHIRIEDNFWQVVSAPDRPFDLVAQAGRIPTAREFISSPEDVPRSEHTAEFGQTDFSGGEGLDFAHRPDNTPFDATRFWASEAIDVIDGHGDVQKLQLDNDFSEIHTIGLGTTYRQSPQMVEANGSLFIAKAATSSNRVTRIDTPAGTPAVTTEDPQAGEAATFVVSVAEVDDLVYAALGSPNGIHRRDIAGTWTHWSDAQPRRIWGLKGRIVGDIAGDKLYEIRSGAVSNSRLLHTISVGDQFLCAADAGAAILVGATNGYIYAFADVDGDLTLRAQTRFHGEEVTAIGAGPSGVVLVGTRQGNQARLYMGELGSSYTVQNAQVIREWDVSNIDDRVISHITFTRDKAFFGFRSAAGNPQVWKFDATTTGLFKMVSGFPSAVLGFAGIESIDDKVFFCNLDHDVFGQQDTYQTAGHLISPLFDHFSPEDKVWAAAKLFGVNLPPNTQAQLFYSTNPDAIEDSTHASWLPIKTLTNTTGVDDVETVLTNAESRWIALKLELSTTDNTATPQVRGYSVRSYAGEGDWEATIPVNVSDVVVRPGHKPTKVPGLGSLRYDTLKTYEGGAVTLEWLYQGETFEGTVEQVGLRSPLQPRRGGNLMVAEVRFIGRRT